MFKLTRLSTRKWTGITSLVVLVMLFSLVLSACGDPTAAPANHYRFSSHNHCGCCDHRCFGGYNGGSSWPQSSPRQRDSLGGWF